MIRYIINQGSISIEYDMQNCTGDDCGMQDGLVRIKNGNEEMLMSPDDWMNAGSQYINTMMQQNAITQLPVLAIEKTKVT